MVLTMPNLKSSAIKFNNPDVYKYLNVSVLHYFDLFKLLLNIFIMATLSSSRPAGLCFNCFLFYFSRRPTVPSGPDLSFRQRHADPQHRHGGRGRGSWRSGKNGTGKGFLSVARIQMCISRIIVCRETSFQTSCNCVIRTMIFMMIVIVL